MALANFFGRASLAASQVLSGFDSAVFEEALNEHTVGVFFDDAAAESPEGRITLELAVNLLARLYPRMAIVSEGAVTGEVVEKLISYAQAINPEIDIEPTLEGVTACLVGGGTAPTAEVPTIYVGSDGWLTHVSSRNPVGSGTTTNPCGAAAAACFGAANIFRALFGSQLTSADLDDFSMSLLGLDPAAPTPLNPNLERVNLRESYLIGLGAIGNGTIWTLSRTPNLRGVLHLIDEESVDLGNLQRYVLTEHKDVGSLKVALAADRLRTTGLDARPHPECWGSYLASRGDLNLEQVAVAVDSGNDRIAIQAALPHWIVNAWTQPGDFGISRHAFLGAHACLACLYLPDEKRKNEDELVAEAIGLPEALQEVRRLLYTREPVERRFIERIAAALEVPVDPLLSFEGRLLKDFYTEAICGGIVLRLGGTFGADRHADIVPMAFQSALAGVVLAAELLAHASGLKEAPPPVTTKIDLLQPLGCELSVPAAKHHSGRCICQDEDYISVYRAKYEYTSPPTDASQSR